MRVSISRSDIRGKVKAPSSKSYTIRGLMCAALAKGESQIVSPLTSDDTDASVKVLGGIGVGIRQAEDLWRVTGGSFHKPGADLFCGDSAATLRFMTAICSLVPGRCRLTAGPSLSRRPVGPLVEALKQLGVNCSCQGELPPVVVEGGKLKGEEATLPGDISSQFVSALLFIAPFAEKWVTIKLSTPLESRPYVLMTLDTMQKFGISAGFSEDLDCFEVTSQAYQPTRYEVQGDWSSASYFLALGALSDGIEVENLNPRSLQGDKVMLDFLREMGAVVEVDLNSVAVRKSKLKGLRADLTDCIDLLPTVAVLAAVADGKSELTGIARARLKESNRVSAVSEGLRKMGIRVSESEDRLVISGTGRPRGAVIDSRSDHRIAMAFSVLGSAFGGMVIESAECVSKTFPQFWDILEGIGGRLEIDGK